MTPEEQKRAIRLVLRVARGKLADMGLDVDIFASVDGAIVRAD
jgi:hypothetical protein